MVRTLRAPTAATGIRHEKVGLPSTITVQAPHCPRPQPNFAPCRCKSLRSAYSSGVDGSMSSVCRTPLTVRVIIVRCPLF